VGRINHYYVPAALIIVGAVLCATSDSTRRHPTTQNGIGLVAILAGGAIFVRRWFTTDGPY
jgi:hypothetical protein